ncbi:hypothetical protein Calkro_1954 [Caldicellulosiruptor kronotskyensis 2002]|uniref:Uncharacterized protein n=1 Tax=Caldicellulosiruptor kronotskyensis (strain DSM 18902 / VKM B-2412 / 2002) TaxID=632348 RepID=E4SGC3_CALK2|nr:hypothetical protein [Caldicellulosiruptor kronotskyensis]ADQ46798.1 hypothetical protein Calkro_1954 [Caldicellulosiruptor kronotskyensis 2002]
MKLRQIFYINLTRKFMAYFATLFVELVLSILLLKFLDANKTWTVNLIISQIFKANAITFFYVSIYLLLVSSQIHMDNCLIILKYTHVEDWWKEKIKILLKDTSIYLLSIYTIPLIVTIMLSSKYLKVLSYREFIFILEFLFIVLLLLVIYGTVYLIVLAIIKKAIAAYIVGILVPFIDFVFIYIFKTVNFSGITLGMLINFLMSYNLSFKKHLFLFGIYLSYFFLLFTFLNIIMTNTLRKIDIYRGDKKSEN